MTIEMALPEDLAQIRGYDCHIPRERLLRSIQDSQVLALKNGGFVLGMLRWSLFWQTIPFLDLIFLDDTARNQGWGSEMMAHWEHQLRAIGYDYAMTSTQADETAWQFYEKLGYRKIGSFLPPDQEAQELIYGKALK